jgi:alkanesulfonate monooxygenase SsuD/methylene tetrahydromethanopterin reductase-like flavin-dependent oxidoreductase (luciferase family)
MELAIISGAFRYPGMDTPQAIEQLGWDARHADQAGFGAMWILERHFSPVRSTGAPGAILGHLAGITSKIKLGYGVALLNIHHPVRLGEEAIWLDWLSGGRVLLGLSPAVADEESAVFQIDEPTRRDRFAEHLAVLKKTLNGGRISHEGRFLSFPEVLIDPAPLRPGGIPLFYATTDVASAKRTAQRMLTPLVGNRPVAIIRQQVAAYREAHAEMGVPAAETNRLLSTFCANQRVYLGRTKAEAESIREEALAALGGARRIIATPDSPDREAAITASMEWAEPYVGEAEGLVEVLKEFEDAGVGILIAGIGTGAYGTPADRIKLQYQLIAEKVIPHFPRAA